jgi:tRNA A37 N6-isopentenylltransferase MiaA
MGNPVPISAANAEAIFLCGPSLAGKSTVCLRIAAELRAAVISADAINAR